MGIPANAQQNKTLIFDHFGHKEGFNASQALCIEKTRDGYLWVGTEQGLLRYDGHNFKTFRTNPYDTNTISSNYIRSIIEDKHGRLWIYANPELNIFDTKTNKAKRVSIPTWISKNGKLDITNFKYDEKNDVMWIGSNKGLLYSQGAEVRLRKENIPGKDEAQGLFTFEISKDGTFWLGANDALYEYHPDSCTTKKYNRPRKSSEEKLEGIMSSYLDEKNQTIWFGTWTHGLLKFDIKNKGMEVFTYADPKKLQNGIFKIDQSGLSGEENILWVGTTDGVKTFNTNNNTFISYLSSDVNDQKGIVGAGFSFKPTSTEGMWIGTYNGLHRYDMYKQNVGFINTPFTDLKSKWVMDDICFESESKRDSIIWFSVGYNSFYKYDLLKQRVLQIPEVLIPYCKNVEPYTLYLDKREILWLSSKKKGFTGYHLKEKKLILPKYEKSIDQIPKILNIEEDRLGNLWFGSTSGIYRYNRDQNHVEEVLPLKEFIEKNKVTGYTYEFTIDGTGKLWILSSSNFKDEGILISYDPKKSDIVMFTPDQIPALKMMKNLNAIESISDDRLLITSYNGICLVNNKQKPISFEFNEYYNGKTLGNFKTILTDHNGHAWLSSHYGVSRYDAETNAITDFTFANSNMGLAATPNIVFSDMTKTLYISQPQSLNYIIVDSIKLAKPGEIILSEIFINDYIFQSVPKSGQRLDLNYKQNTINLEFTNLNFTNSGSNFYHYKLDGITNDWQAMAENKISFNNLGYGEYGLRVKAINSFGLNSPNEFVLYLDISPPYWRTWWFNGFILFLISSFIYGFFKYRDVQRQKLEKLRHHIARDLHDDMGSTLSHIRMMSEREAMKKEASQSFKIIADKTAELMSNMSEIIWSINPKNESLKNILGKIQEFAIDTLEPLGMEIYFDLDEISENVKLDPEKRRHFYLIFKEAINNTAKYSKADKVTFSFKFESNRMITAFQDDGIGFDPMLLSKGNGLKNMASRAQALNGKIDIDTSNKGTTIVLTLKA